MLLRGEASKCRESFGCELPSVLYFRHQSGRRHRPDTGNAEQQDMVATQDRIDGDHCLHRTHEGVDLLVEPIEMSSYRRSYG